MLASILLASILAGRELGSARWPGMSNRTHQAGWRSLVISACTNWVPTIGQEGQPQGPGRGASTRQNGARTTSVNHIARERRARTSQEECTGCCQLLPTAASCCHGSATCGPLSMTVHLSLCSISAAAHTVSPSRALPSTISASVGFCPSCRRTLSPRTPLPAASPGPWVLRDAATAMEGTANKSAASRHARGRRGQQPGTCPSYRCICSEL